MLGLGFGLNKWRRLGGGYVGLLDLYPNAAAAYSLRKLRAAYSGSAVRVRRSSDNTEQDIGFTAQGELDTASLLSFVNEDVVVYTSDFSSGSEDLGEFNGVGSDGETIAGVSDAYKFTLTGGSVVHFATLSLPEYNQIYSITLDYYIPSGQTVTDIEASLGTTSQHTLDSVGAWTTETFTFVASDDSSPNNRRLRFVTNAYTNVNADGDVFYLKNIVVTQTTADGHVTTWYDQSLSNDATQTTAADQPKIVSAGSLVTENGKAAIEFDGTDDYFDIIVGITSGFGIFGVYKNTKAASYLTGTLQLGRRSSNEYRFHFTGFSANGGTHSDNQVLIAGLEDGANARVYANGVEQASAVSSFVSATLVLIGNNFPDGTFQEVIIFDSDQSTNRTGIETNINTFYSVYP